VSIVAHVPAKWIPVRRQEHAPLGTPEWLTPAAIFAALNTNKELTKIVPKTLPSMFQSIPLVNGGLMAESAR
jgi:hypothetical protein